MLARPMFFSMSVAAALVVSANGSAHAQNLDEVNGLWKASLNGTGSGAALTESYPEIGVRLRFQGKVYTLNKAGEWLVLGTPPSVGINGALDGNTIENFQSDIKLKMVGFKPESTGNPADDKLEGTFFGKKAVFTRDITPKPPIEIDLTQPRNMPWVRFMREVLIPKTAEDRDTYHKFDKVYGHRWLKSTQLGSTGYWMTKGWIKNEAAYTQLSNDMHGVLNTPRSILKTKFSTALKSAISPAKQGEFALALSSLGMYYSTASGGAVRLIVTSNRDSLVYYITDRRANSRTGLVINATPLHKPLASSFGKWQNDAGEMQLEDDVPYMRGVLEMMTKSTTASMNNVSGTGRSAFTDYFGIMAIEDQRGVMFNNDSLDWGRNMTQASFDIAIIRALGHGVYRQKPKYDKASGKIVLTSAKELAMQVIDGDELKPGTPSYIDVQNGADNALEGGHKGGNDCQVYSMSPMETLTTSWLRKEHAADLNRLEKACAPFGVTANQGNIFEAITIMFYDNANFAKVTPAQASEITEAAMNVFAVVKADSKNLEKFMLANGIKKSTEWAARASGF
jgi:hypothetical protein